MISWFRKKPKSALATLEERAAIFTKQHQVFREVDAGFHAYLEIFVANPQWEDGQIEQELVRRGVAPALAEECVTFGPMAWGREVAEQLGVSCSPMFRLQSIIDGIERDLPLANEVVYAWARAVIVLYQTPERNEVFKLVSTRSAEVNAVNNALNSGTSAADLRFCKLQPSLVYLRRALADG